MNATRVCSVDGCDQKFFSKTFCKAHYARNYKYGDPLKGGPRQGRSDSERFEALLTRNGDSDCWEWVGTLNASGYGRFRFRGSGAYLAHRASYEMHVGEIPDGLVIDHLCRNRSCVNPDHLEPVTDRENLIRGESVVAVGMRRDTCSAGHVLQGENLGKSSVGGRKCKACAREYQREYDARRRNHRVHDNCGVRIEGIGLEVLAVWPDHEPFIRSRDLIDRLVATNPDRWGPDSCNGRRLSPQRMSKQVELELGISTRRNAATLVGYFREDWLLARAEAYRQERGER